MADDDDFEQLKQKLIALIEDKIENYKEMHDEVEEFLKDNIGAAHTIADIFNRRYPNVDVGKAQSAASYIFAVQIVERFPNIKKISTIQKLHELFMDLLPLFLIYIDWKDSRGGRSKDDVLMYVSTSYELFLLRCRAHGRSNKAPSWVYYSEDNRGIGSRSGCENQKQKEKKMERKEAMIWLSQWLCPKRHCSIALMWDDSKETAEQIERQGEAVFSLGQLNRWCGICNGELHVEHGITKFRTLEEAAREGRETEKANLLARELIGKKF